MLLSKRGAGPHESMVGKRRQRWNVSFQLKPSLERMALTKIAIALWNEADVRAATTDRILQSDESKRKRTFQQAEETVIQKLPALLLPETIKNKLITVISGIGWEIFKWREFLFKRYMLDLNPALCWTSHGTMDTKKTVEALIKTENIEVVRRYRLACDYCFEDDIPKLWDKLSENLRGFFSEKDDRSYFVRYFSHRMKNQMLNDHQHAFRQAALNGNKAAIDFFFQRLTHEVREKSLVGLAKEMLWYGNCSSTPSYFLDCLFFVFSQLDEREQIDVFKYSPPYPQSVLEYLLEWPWQYFFVETANRMWDILSVHHFHSLLRAIVAKVQRGYKYCDYQNLFGEFWQQSPNDHKVHVISELTTVSHHSGLLSDLFQLEDTENVRLILKSATVEQRKQFLLSSGTCICERLVYDKKLDSLKLLREEFLSISSKEVLISFKEELKDRMGWRLQLWSGHCEYAEKINDWNNFFQLLEDLIQDNNHQ